MLIIFFLERAMFQEPIESSDFEEVVEKSEVRAALVDELLVSTESQTTENVPRSHNRKWVPFDCVLAEFRSNQSTIDNQRDLSPSTGQEENRPVKNKAESNNAGTKKPVKIDLNAQFKSSKLVKTSSNRCMMENS
ncbi:uncharacterized protein LOC111252486 isoform X2 [Varroa destructor]|uniref:Uncharacterized protein n=1 Tax=Varroa destructor TaxID=109461 RepID=A0A7M7KK40_VARDE|nr:uncharacterized protein LOC111252486 isoform X2 [Varroa destructor]